MVAEAWLRIREFRLVRLYRKKNRRWPRVALPTRFGEKMLWRKVVDRSPLFVVFSDKLATKDYVRERCPDLAIPETLWVGTDADAIPDEILHGNVYVKANHGCDFNHHIRGGQVDRGQLKIRTDAWLGKRHDRHYGEWAYSQVEPKLFVEEAVGDADADLLDFQVRAGNGRFVLGSMIGKNKSADQWIEHLDQSGAVVDRPAGTPRQFAKKEGQATGNFVEAYRQAVVYAAELTKGVDYVRCDFLWNGTTLYAGEITVYPGGGIGEPGGASDGLDMQLGYRLEVSWFLTHPQPLPARLYANALRRKVQQRSLARGLPPL
jgi:hypothetical protein